MMQKQTALSSKYHVTVSCVLSISPGAVNYYWVLNWNLFLSSKLFVTVPCIWELLQLQIVCYESQFPVLQRVITKGETNINEALNIL